MLEKFNNQKPPKAMSSSAHSHQSFPQFNIFTWYPLLQSCHRYFLEKGQHSEQVKAVAAFVNIRLPYQKEPYSTPAHGTSSSQSGPRDIHSSAENSQALDVSLTPYIRRLVATGQDAPGVLQDFFGDGWVGGVGALHEIERRNYLFAAKSTSWTEVKRAYDMSQEETVPFLSPLVDTSEKEIQAAESTWSEWLAMQDWMIGPRAPYATSFVTGVKREWYDNEA